MTGTTQVPPDNNGPLVMMDVDDNCSQESNGNKKRRRSSMERLASTVGQGIKHSCSHWGVLMLGQVLSFLLACSGAAQATLHLNCSLSAPTFATGLIYFVLSFLIIPLYVRQRRGLGRHDPISGGYEQDLPKPVVVVCQEEEDGEPIGSGGVSVRRFSMSQSLENTTKHSFLGRISLHSPSWAYFCIALLDVEANYLTVLAFRFTTLTSVTLFDALAIPSAMVLSKIFLKRTYLAVHLIGAVVCMTGIVVNVLTDYKSDQEASQRNDDDVAEKEKEEYPHRMLGDMLAIMGGLLYGANDVLQEYVVKTPGGPMEFLAMLGFFGVSISVVQVLLLERQNVAEFFSESMVRGGEEDSDESTCGIATGIWLLMWYVVSLVFAYVGGSYFLMISEAALFNLSLLTGDLWSVTFSVFAERIIPSPLFFVALVLIVSGVLLYETGPSPMVAAAAAEESNREDDAHEDSFMPSRLATSERSGRLDELSGDPWRYDEVEMTPQIS